MPTGFPTSLDSFPSGATLAGLNQDGSPYTGPALNPYHSTLHGDLGAAVAALEAKVGIDGSLDASSVDYFMSTLAVQKTRQILTAARLTGGGDLSADRTIDLATSGVTAGSYTLADITVDAYGRITAASDGSASASPGGSDTYLQFNDSGSFGGAAGLVYNKTTKCPSAPWGSGTTHNERLGAGAGASAATGDENTVVGNGAGAGITSAGNNVCVGYNAGVSLTSGGSNTIVGSQADASGGGNVVVGSGQSAGSGNFNTIIGQGNTLTGGQSYTAIFGYQNVVSSYGNVVFGTTSGISGNNNTVFGANHTVAHAWCFVVGNLATTAFDGQQLIAGRLVNPTITLNANDSTDNNQLQGGVAGSWSDSTHASRKGQIDVGAYDCNCGGSGGPSGMRVGLTVIGDGSQPLVGFYGATPIARAVLATGAGHTVDDVITALQNLGLVKQS